MMGPDATPIPVIAPQMPMALARSARSVKVLVMIDSVVGNTSAAPTPMTTRAPMSASVEPARAARTLPRPKMISPMMSERRRPNRSLNVPPTSTRAANARL